MRLENGFDDVHHRTEGGDGVEVDVVDAGLIQLAALVDGPFGAESGSLGVGLAFHGFLRQFLWHVAVEGLRHLRNLRELGEGFDAGDDGNSDAHGTRLLDEAEELSVVVEQLGDGILCA